MQVPQFKHLSTTEIMNYARKKFNQADYLPKYPKFRMPNRLWVCNLSKGFHFLDFVFTKLGVDFKT